MIPGAKAPKLVTEDMVKLMKKGSAIVDVAIDQELAYFYNNSLGSW